MILVFSDLHLGRHPDRDALLLDELDACIQAYAFERPELVFLGDTFDAFVDHPKSIPAIVHAWWRVAGGHGLEVTYLPGNHDRWHGTTFEKTFGLVPEDVVMRTLAGRRILLSHGDQAARAGRLKKAFWRFTGHPWTRITYVTLLPFGAGRGLAAFVSRRFSRHDPEDTTVQALRDAAADMLNSAKIDAVVFGHCHHAERLESPGGVYLNTGSWYSERTFGILSQSDQGDVRIELASWTGTTSVRSGRNREPESRQRAC